MTSVLPTEKRINVVQGEWRVCKDPDVVLTTLLGSCVAACIRDPFVGIGGMNHFLVPGVSSQDNRMEFERQGAHLMELLINDLMRSGADRSRLEAKLFGGARMMSGLSDIGHKNAVFARRFLEHEGIQVLSADVGDTRGRRIQFWPVSGRVRRSYVPARSDLDMNPLTLPVPVGGEAELF